MVSCMRDCDTINKKKSESEAALPAAKDAWEDEGFGTVGAFDFTRRIGCRLEDGAISNEPDAQCFEGRHI